MERRAPSPPPEFLLGDWQVHPALGRLIRGDETVHLEPRPMDVLVCLMRHAGEVLPGETIIDQVWTEQFVGEAVLRRAIATLRRALGDDARNPSFIENIPKRGYRLIAEIEVLGKTDEVTAKPSPGVQESPGSAGRSETAAGSGVQEALPPHAPEGPLFSLRYGKRRFRLTEGENLIGRDPKAQVQVRSEKASRRHARILIQEGQATLEDLGSKNGTYLRGERLDEPELLEDGDAIRIGRADMTFHSLYSAATVTERGSGADAD